MDVVPKNSIRSRLTPKLRRAVPYAVTGVVSGAAVVLYFTKYRTVVTWCHITMADVDLLKTQGQGVIGFGMETGNKILFALPDKV